MALIVVCEDDASTRALITAVLSKAGHQVEAFDNGLKGYARLLEGDAELLISDVQMPGKDGFELVAQVREDKDLLRLPCILLTSLQARAHMRIGMTSGADDYVTKPFQPSELLEAVNSQLNRAMQRYVLQAHETQRTVDAALGQRTNELMQMYEQRLRSELQSRWESSYTGSTELSGSLLACSILQQEDWLAVVSSTQMAEMARHFFNKVADCAALFAAEHLQFVGDGLLIVFDANADTVSIDHANRAQRLMQSMDSIRTSMSAYVQRQFESVSALRPLPSFDCSLVVHEGRLSLGKLDGVAGGIEQLVPVGQDVQRLSELMKAAQALRWSVLLSEEAVHHWKHEAVNLSVSEQRQIRMGGKTLNVYRGS